MHMRTMRVKPSSQTRKRIWWEDAQNMFARDDGWMMARQRRKWKLG